MWEAYGNIMKKFNGFYRFYYNIFISLSVIVAIKVMFNNQILFGSFMNTYQSIIYQFLSIKNYF